MKARTLLTALFSTLILGAGCASQCVEPTPASAPADGEPRSAASWRQSYLMLGKETYEQSCMSCHGSGVGGAPAVGDRDSWSDRSPLWSAVLLEHAKSGYLGMPAKGGDPGLTERAVEAAGEYMLGETFPELPRD